MPTCTFFGHRDLNTDIRPLLLKELSHLINSRGVTDFYVGNNGKFDFAVHGVLRELSLCFSASPSPLCLNRIEKRRGIAIHSFKNNSGAAALIFPEGERDKRFLLVSSPPPTWLLSDDLSKIQIGEAGVYCMYFLFFSEKGGKASLCINGRVVHGSETTAEDGIICNTAVCSIRDTALPCTLSASFDASCVGGVFLVVKCLV